MKEKKKDIRLVVAQDAQQGKFHVVTRENAKLIRGSHCYVYGTAYSAILLEINEQGLQFGEMVYYRGETAAAIGGSMQSATVTSLLVTAATTQTYSLFIPYGAITACDRIQFAEKIKYEKCMMGIPSYYMISFRHEAKNRDEWMGFCVVTDEGTEEELFVQNLSRRGFAFTELQSLETPTSKEAASMSADTIIGKWKNEQGMLCEFFPDGAMILGGDRYVYKLDGKKMNITTRDGVIHAVYKLEGGTLFTTINNGTSRWKRETAKAAFCVQCGQPLTADQVFCGNCGTKI